MALVGVHTNIVRDSMKPEIRSYADPEPDGYASSRRKSVFGKILGGFGKLTAPVATTVGFLFPPLLPLVAVGAGLYGMGMVGDYVANKNAVPPPPNQPSPQNLSFPGLGGGQQASVQSVPAHAPAAQPGYISDPSVMRILSAKGDSTQEAFEKIG